MRNDDSRFHLKEDNDSTSKTGPPSDEGIGTYDIL